MSYVYVALMVVAAGTGVLVLSMLVAQLVFKLIDAYDDAAWRIRAWRRARRRRKHLGLDESRRG